MQVKGEREWASLLDDCGWGGTGTSRVLDPRGPVTEDQFEAADWAPSYADYLAQKRAGTLCLEARRR